MLSLQSVTKQYGSTRAVDAVEIDVATGSTTILIGPSGCGKSTLLRIINGLVRPDSGTVHIDGELLDDRSVTRMRHRMGYVIQEGGLFPHLTAGQNVALLPRFLGWNQDRIDARIQELLDLTDLDAQQMGKHPDHLSGGQRQRVGLMRALMLDPELLLLDEPLGALDPMIRADLQVDLRRIFRSVGKTVVMVTHDLAEAAYFADEIVLMQDGAVVQRGTMRELVDNPARSFVERFVAAQRLIRGAS